MQDIARPDSLSRQTYWVGVRSLERQTLLKRYNLSQNPFSEYVAENEPEIDGYFVPTPYYASILERAENSRSMILFGARGAGKSAARLKCFKDLWRGDEPETGRPLTITLDDFSRALQAGLSRLTLAHLIDEVNYLAIEAIIIWLSKQSEDERNKRLDDLSKPEYRQLVDATEAFYLSKPDYVRQMTGTQARKLLNQAIGYRALASIGGRIEPFTALIGKVIEAIVNHWADSDVDIDSDLSKLLKAPKSVQSSADYARAVLGKLVGIVRSLGFSGLCVLVDKVDETDATGDSADASAKLLHPLLANIQLLEIDGLGWIFFLWDRLRDRYASGKLNIRLDKIPSAPITWSAGDLETLINERLRHFSDGAVQEFRTIADETAPSIEELIALSNSSPRELVRLLDTVFREHEQVYASEAESPPLSGHTVNSAMDLYSAEAVKQTIAQKHLQQLVRLKELPFTNQDAQEAFKVNPNAARNRVKGWEDAGLVAQVGTQPAIGDAGGKPAFLYNVLDPRLRRVLEHRIPLGPEYEGRED